MHKIYVYYIITTVLTRTFESFGVDRYNTPFTIICLAKLYVLLVYTYTYFGTTKIFKFASYATANKIIK